MTVLEQDLTDLAVNINHEHYLGLGRLSNAVPHFIRAGELLLEVKDRLAKGDWIGWLETNFEDSVRTAQLYMRLALYQEQIPEDMPSLAEAMRWLNGRPRTDSGHWAIPGSKTGDRSAAKRRAREKRRRERRALEREDRARLMRKKGGTIASGYSHLRRALQDFERASETAPTRSKARDIDHVIHALYEAEDLTKEIL